MGHDWAIVVVIVTGRHAMKQLPVKDCIRCKAEFYPKVIYFKKLGKQD